MAVADRVLGAMKYSGVVVHPGGCAENFLMGEHSFWNRAQHELKLADIHGEMNMPRLPFDLE